MNFSKKQVTLKKGILIKIPANKNIFFIIF